MTEDPEPAAAPHGFRSVLRLTWIFLGLALLIALPFFIFGDRLRLVEDDRQVGRRFLLLHLAQELVEHAAEAVHGAGRQPVALTGNRRRAASY